ncbi:unnamed protein product [Paramecium pentaurelia]|uniref:Uncharacterized protein n=1 Tax=Paramecium pentaurelia TaxID=43138 RepID=A0A8S1S8Z3_9CILI|nr:unnamed protein product [Paramecium pentaurelia]
MLEKITFNKDKSIVLATCDKNIKVFEFKQVQLRQTQILSGHKNNVEEIYSIYICKS